MAEPSLLLAGPAEPGPDLPPAGRSLFDTLFEVGSPATERPVADHVIPYPFEQLLARIETLTAPHRAKTVLIPIGRSLQRFAADPDFFASPRVVVAVDAQGADCGDFPCPALKDRLYLGYQERAKVIEVISYNEDAGRFEFQVVEDYGPGETPRVRYASRTLCTTCHQAQAPIFAIALWSETNANARVGDGLAARASAFHGVPARQDLAVANAIDLSTDRASRFAFANFVWQNGCGAFTREDARRCRATLLLGALRNRLGAKAGSRTDRETAALARRLHERLTAIAPGGLAIPSPDIPDRDPLLAVAGGADPSDVVEPDGRFDPTQPRLPLVFWEPSDPPDAFLAILLRDMAAFFLTQDLDQLSRLLQESGKPLEALVGQMVERYADGNGSPIGEGPIRRQAIMSAISQVLAER